MNQHLFSKIEKIVKIHNGSSIKHTAFDGIRNRPSVIAAMDKLGYRPDCPANPYAWRFGDSPVKSTGGVSPVNRGYNSNGSRIREKLISGELLIAKEQPVSKRYVIQIVGDLRKEGYQVQSNFNKKREVTSYQVLDTESKQTPIIRKSSQCSRLLDDIIKNGFINVSDFDGDKRYLVTLVWQMRKEGHEIDTIRKGSRVVRYELVK